MRSSGAGPLHGSAGLASLPPCRSSGPAPIPIGHEGRTASATSPEPCASTDRHDRAKQSAPRGPDRIGRSWSFRLGPDRGVRGSRSRNPPRPPGSRAVVGLGLSTGRDRCGVGSGGPVPFHGGISEKARAPVVEDLQPGPGPRVESDGRPRGQIVKLNVLVISRQSHQPKVWVPPSILAKPRRPGWSVSLGFSIGMMTS